MTVDQLHDGDLFLSFVQVEAATSLNSLLWRRAHENDASPIEGLRCTEGGAAKSSTTLHAPSGHAAPSSANLAIVTYRSFSGRAARPPSLLCIDVTRFVFHGGRTLTPAFFKAAEGASAAA